MDAATTSSVIANVMGGDLDGKKFRPEKQMFSKGKKEKLITDRLAYEEENDEDNPMGLPLPILSKKDKLTKKTKEKNKAVHAKSRQGRAGLLFPISRIQNMLKLKVPANARVGVTAAVYVAAVLEYLVAELCELSGNRARIGFKSKLDEEGKEKKMDFSKKRARITPQFLNFAIREDKEFNELLNRVTVAGGGVLPKSDKQLHSIFPASKTQKKQGMFEDEDDDDAITDQNILNGGASSSSKGKKNDKQNSDDASPTSTAVMDDRITKTKIAKMDKMIDDDENMFT